MFVISYTYARTHQYMYIHTFTFDPINAGIAHIIASIHINAAIIIVTSVVRLPVTPVNKLRITNE